MFRKRAILIAISSLVAISPNSAIQFTRTFESSNNEPSSLIANEQTVTLQDEIVRENRWYHELRDFYFTNGFSLAPTDLNDVTIRYVTQLCVLISRKTD
ncbi:hypothetical protein BV898_06395 [Hypsibius exemplaris]|uniref:Uncharacterized protein n=1 Tax=Hypsibius exemplaris TaxID=2072580 RepID=A0A1W0WWQ1_HYPEX|nr:hypothetical protein BV898_06395 [Hypsibius exemplaris]